MKYSLQRSILKCSIASYLLISQNKCNLIYDIEIDSNFFCSIVSFIVFI